MVAGCRAVLPGEGCCHTNSTHSSPGLLLLVSNHGSLSGFGESLRRGCLAEHWRESTGLYWVSTLYLRGAALTVPPPARSGCSCWWVTMAGHRWLVPPMQGKGLWCSSVSLSSILGPVLLQLLGAVPRPPWDEGWLLVTWGFGEVQEYPCLSVSRMSWCCWGGCLGCG